jgi:hypothetical protein
MFRYGYSTAYLCQQQDPHVDVCDGAMMASVCRQLVRVLKRSTAALSNALPLSWAIVTRTTGQSMFIIVRLNVFGED